MFDPFTNCFTFLLHHNPITGPRRRRRRTTRTWFKDDEDISGVSSQFRQVFKLIDANGDGKISASELGDIIVCLGSSPNSKRTDKGLAVKEAEGIVRVLDFNGDGFVDMDEFMMGVKKEEKEEEEDDDEDDEEREELKDAFFIYDSDRNGLISAKELRRVMVNLGWRDCSIRDCKNMIRAVDLNGDGFVDFHEFRSMMRSNSNRRRLPNH